MQNNKVSVIPIYVVDTNKVDSYQGSNNQANNVKEIEQKDQGQKNVDYPEGRKNIDYPEGDNMNPFKQQNAKDVNPPFPVLPGLNKDQPYFANNQQQRQQLNNNNKEYPEASEPINKEKRKSQDGMSKHEKCCILIFGIIWAFSISILIIPFLVCVKNRYFTIGAIIGFILQAVMITMLAK